MPMLPSSFVHINDKSGGFKPLSRYYLDFTINKTYQIPINPTIMIVVAPNPGSDPFHVDGCKACPSPRVETYHTKTADKLNINSIKTTMPYFA